MQSESGWSWRTFLNPGYQPRCCFELREKVCDERTACESFLLLILDIRCHRTNKVADGFQQVTTIPELDVKLFDRLQAGNIRLKDARHLVVLTQGEGPVIKVEVAISPK